MIAIVEKDMKLVALPFVLVFAILLISCGGSDDNGDEPGPPTAEDPVAQFPVAEGPDGEWVLQSMVLEGDMAIPLPGPLELRIDGAEVGGDTGCNTMGGSASFAPDGSVSIGDLFWTEMACAEVERMDFEQHYTTAFLQVNSWTAEADELVLTGPGVSLRYNTRVAPPDLPIIATPWTLDTFFDGSSAMNAAGMDQVTVTFGEASVVVEGRCWTIEGPARIEPGTGGNISADLTDYAPDYTCEDTAFLDEMVTRLAAATEYSVVESRLTLSTASEPILSLRGT